MKLLSIIIPIYNVEPYVEKCLRSLEKQDISTDDYEILCINDGSPDNSREIVLRLQKEFRNIFLIDQENQGVSIARNNGVKKAGGKYLLFIDPDDFVQVNSLGGILKDAVSNQAQIVIPGFTFVDINNHLIEVTNNYRQEEKILTGLEAYDNTHVKGQTGADLAVGIIFEADFLKNNNLHFLPDVPFLEDGEFLARTHCLASRCLMTKRPLYSHVVIRQGSATHSDLFNTDRARKGFVIAANNLKYFQQTQSLDIKQKLFLNGSIVQFVLLVVYSALRTRSIEILKTAINNLKASDLGKLSLEGCKGWYLICGKPYNFSPYLGALALLLYLKLDNWHNNLLKGGRIKRK
jgi:glycosyltransferase involved in cell wall biosynthesis